MFFSHDDLDDNNLSTKVASDVAGVIAVFDIAAVAFSAAVVDVVVAVALAVLLMLTMASVLMSLLLLLLPCCCCYCRCHGSCWCSCCCYHRRCSCFSLQVAPNRGEFLWEGER